MANRRGQPGHIGVASYDTIPILRIVDHAGDKFFQLFKRLVASHRGRLRLQPARGWGFLPPTLTLYSK